HDHEHHHDHDEDECCHDHEHHHDHDEDECCHDHEHHHDHDEDECCHDHEHHHDHGPDCTCGCHDHHHHHADEVFGSFGLETAAKYSSEDIENILKELGKEDKYGFVLRAKGMVPSPDGSWVYFDYVPEESNVRAGQPQPTGRFCVIGSKLQEENLKVLFAK
ncbi:MAG: cobalamin biosynthesis protein CobW, partial [Lachnospiraceae bacterium]